MMTVDNIDDAAYEPGSPKRSDYTEPLTCVLCYGRGGHFEGCVELA